MEQKNSKNLAEISTIKPSEIITALKNRGIIINQTDVGIYKFSDEYQHTEDITPKSHVSIKTPKEAANIIQKLQSNESLNNFTKKYKK